MFSKVLFSTFVVLCFSSLKDSTCETWKKFVSFQKLSSFSGKPNFRILDIQISLCDQLSKHKTSRFYKITWEVNTVCWWNLASLCYITNENCIKNLKKLRTEN